MFFVSLQETMAQIVAVSKLSKTQMAKSIAS
jgi:hypothetical protein